MKGKKVFYFLAIAIPILALSACGTNTSKPSSYKSDAALESSQVMSKNTPIHVHQFSTSRVNLGGESNQDTAIAMLKSAPHLLAVDIVEMLRHSGFTRVTLDESHGEPSEEALNVTGSFTSLDPGSQNLRVWIGFGAGKSKVCVDGLLTDSKGETLTEFSQCRSGLGWGTSGPQLENEAVVLGQSITDSLVQWSRTGQ